MSNDLLVQKSWWQRTWKWWVALTVLILILVGSLFTSGFGGILGDYSKAYADPLLYDGALESVGQNERVQEVLGDLQPIDAATILNGSVIYSDGDRSVNSTIKITGEHGKAMLDIVADRMNDAWIYKKITIRIKKPIEKKETIEILTSVD